MSRDIYIYIYIFRDNRWRLLRQKLQPYDTRTGDDDVDNNNDDVS